MMQPTPSSQMHTLLTLAMVLAVSGCATRYENRDVSKNTVSDSFGDVVVYQSAEEFKSKPPECLGVLPLSATQKQFEPTQDLRKALHANLAPTGIKLVPMQRIDTIFKSAATEAVNLKNVSAATACDTLVSGEITDRQARFLGVYSEVKVAANIRITRVSTGTVIWRGKHTAVVRDGGLPINPISIIGGSISAGMNLRDEQITRTTNDLARRLVIAIPNLKYTDKDSDLVSKTPASSHSTDSSVHGFIASLEDRKTPELIHVLTTALDDPKWSDPKDRLVLSEYFLKKDPNNSQAMYANATARLENAQPEESLLMANRALVIDATNPDIQFLKGRALLQLNQPVEATLPILKAAGSENPKPVYFTALGLAYNQIGNHDFALAALTRSLQLAPDQPYVLIQQAIAYVGVGDELSASAILKKCMLLSIIDKDHRNASRALSIFKSMDLSAHMSPEELVAYETKINGLLTTP